MIIEPRFELAGRFANGMAAVKVNKNGDGRWGFIDKSGEFVIPPQFNQADAFVDGLAAVQLNPNLNSLSLQPTSLSGSDRGGAWGFINREGLMAIAPQFQELGHFSEGLAAVRSGTKWGYIDETGNWTVPAKFDVAGNFRGDLALVGERNSTGAMAYGYINRSGTLMLAPQTGIVTASSFSEDLCAMTVAKTWYERLSPFF